MLLSFKRDFFRYQKYLLLTAKLAETKKARVYTGLILTFFTISFFALLALRPTFLTIANLIAEIRQKEEVNRKLSVKIQQLSLAQTAYFQVAPRLYLVDETLPTEIEFSSLLGNLESEASGNEVSFSGLTFEKISFEGQKEGLQEIGYKTSLIGSFENLESFLEKVFNLRRIIKSSKFSLTKKMVGEAELLDFSGDLVSLFQTKKTKLE